MTKRTKMMIVAFATLILAGLLVGCSDSMTNPSSEINRNDNQTFDYQVTATMLITPLNGAEGSTVPVELFSVESVNGKIANAPVLNQEIEALEVYVGQQVQLVFDFLITNDRGVPQLATWIGNTKIQDFDGKKGERFSFPVDVITSEVTEVAGFQTVELWVRKDHPNFAQLLWGAAQNVNIAIKVVEPPVVETVYEWVDGVELVYGNNGNPESVNFAIAMAGNATSQGHVTVKVNGVSLKTSNSNEVNNSTNLLVVKKLEAFNLEVNTVEVKVAKHTSGNTTIPAGTYTYTIYKVDGVLVGNHIAE